MGKFKHLMLGVVILFPFQSFSQKNVEVKHAEVNFAELAKYYEEHPLPLKQVMPLDEDEDEATAPNHKLGPASEVHLYKPATSASRGTSGSTPLPISPSPSDTFLSTQSPGTNIPPDTHGAVDSTYCVTAINSNVHIQTRTRINVSNVTLDGFWSSVLPAGTDAFDPRVFYDAGNKRWIIVTDAVNLSTQKSSTLMVGVSATNNPTGTWHLYAVAVDPSNTTWLDFPNVGYNNKWVVIAGNIFSSGSGPGGGAAVYIFDYASMRAGVPTLPAPKRINQTSSFSICPAQTFDPAESNLFCLETWSGSNGQLNLWKISGAVGSETMTHIGYPATSQHWHTGGPGGSDFGPQLGTTNRLDMGDTRITSVIQRNNKLWCAHNVFLPSSGTATRCSIMWWQIDTLANPVQNGLVNDPTSTFFYAYPSIAVNSSNDALIGCGVFSATLHPSAGYALRMHSDATDSIRPVNIYRHGIATYYTTFGGSKNRWGDYSGTSVDPRNDQNFWTLQEASSAGSSANWQTWWANVQVCPAVPAVSYSITNQRIFTGIGDTVTFTGTAATGATYTWSFGGGTGLPGTGAGPHTVTWSTPGTKTITLTVADSGCSVTYTDTIHVSTILAAPVSGIVRNHISIVPNPNDGYFEVSFTEAINKPIRIALTDMSGRKVYSNEFRGTGNKVAVRTDNLRAGVYTAQIIVDQDVTVQKVTINR